MVKIDWRGLIESLRDECRLEGDGELLGVCVRMVVECAYDREYDDFGGWE